MAGGNIEMLDHSDIYSNTANDGGGVYLIAGELTLRGEYSEIMDNTAEDDGGGIYALESTVILDQDAELAYNIAGADGSGDGGGAYLDESNLMCDKSHILGNRTDEYGGGVYATDHSVLYVWSQNHPQHNHHFASESTVVVQFPVFSPQRSLRMQRNRRCRQRTKSP